MFWTSARRFTRTFRFRLTVAVAGFFSLLLASSFVTVYFMLQKGMRERIDRGLRGTVRALAEQWAEDGLTALRDEFDEDVSNRGKDRVFCRLILPDLSIPVSSDLSAWPWLPPPPVRLLSPAPGRPPAIYLETLELPERDAPVRTIYLADETGRVLQYGYSLEGEMRSLARYRELFSSLVAAMVFVGIIAAYGLAGRAVRSISGITEAVHRVGEGDLSSPIPAQNAPQEIERLRLAFNSMQDRIARLITGLKDVTSTIAHDLRSPITRIRGMAETTLTSGGDAEECRETLGVIIEESDRLIDMINTTLTIAEADGGAVDYRTEAVDLRALVAKGTTLLVPVAEALGLRLSTDLPDEPVVVRGREGMLQRVLANLMDNAVKFTDSGGAIRVRLHVEDDMAVLEVRDTGQGIDAVDLPRVFERFYRGERSRTSPGNGLGLAFARSVVRATGGDIAAASTPGRGSVFTVRLPLADGPSSP